MSTLLLTLIIAFVFIVLALAGLAIGWLITGTSKITAGACGRDPHKQRDETCGTHDTCPLCKPEPQEKDVYQGKSRDDSGDV